MTKKLLALATVLALLCSSTLTAYAAEYNLDEGSVTVGIDEQGTQYVNQNGIKADDSAPTITGGDGSQSITVSTTGENKANLTIENVNARTIEVGASNAAITVSGENNKVSNDSGGAGIHVSSGDLTITGDGTLDVKSVGTFGKCAAAIGSNSSEEMSGSISIKDEAKVTATVDSNISGAGAGIGSGRGGDMSGEINIENNATVNATSNKPERGGAGIGSGEAGDITESGSISIKDEAKVTATATGNIHSGAGIGSGTSGKMSGKIDIENNATVNATSNAASSGAAIGSGSILYAEMSGSISIKDEAKVTATATGIRAGAGIGSGQTGTMSGTIAISNKATVDASSTGSANSGEAIGAGAKGTNTGTIRYFDPDPEPTAPGSVACYRVVGENGLSVSCTSQQKDGVLTITVQRDEASFLITRVQLKDLADRGVKTIVFVTDGAASALAVSDLLTLAKLGDSFCLTHKGAEATLTLNGETLTDVRKPWSPEQP